MSGIPSNVLLLASVAGRYARNSKVSSSDVLMVIEADGGGLGMLTVHPREELIEAARGELDTEIVDLLATLPTDMIAVLVVDEAGEAWLLPVASDLPRVNAKGGSA